MKFFLKLLFICSTIGLVSCETDDPKPVEPAREILATEKTNEKDSVVVQPPATPPASTAAGSPAPSAYPDSAFYRAASFGDMPYRIMFPRSYDSTKSYPIVIFLHGIDERGTDNQKQLIWGASLFKSDSVSREYPSFVVFPQCPSSKYWSDQTVLEKLKGLVDHLTSTQSIDPKRIYIEGLSMGAYGTYSMVAEYPDLFAAAIAISGDGDLSKAKQMAKVDWKIYGGKKDTIVPGEKSEKMADALRKSGANVSVKIYPNATHVDTWVNAFAEPDFVSWIFSRSKK